MTASGMVGNSRFNVAQTALRRCHFRVRSAVSRAFTSVNSFISNGITSVNFFARQSTNQPGGANGLQTCYAFLCTNGVWLMPTKTC